MQNVQNGMQNVQMAQFKGLVEKMSNQNVKFMMVWNFKDADKTQEAVRKHKEAVKAGGTRNLILMAFQHQVLPEYTILALTTYPIDEEIRNFGFNPVRKDKANWIPIQYRNRKGKEHLNSRDGDYAHTTNYLYMTPSEVQEYLDMAHQIEMVYK